MKKGYHLLGVAVVFCFILSGCMTLSTEMQPVKNGFSLPVFERGTSPASENIELDDGAMIQISTWKQYSDDYGFHLYVSYIDLPETEDPEKPRKMMQGLILNGYYDEFLAALENEGQFLYRGGNAGVMHFLDTYGSDTGIDLVRAELALFGIFGIEDNLHFKRSCFFEWGDDLVYMMMLYYPEYMKAANRIEQEILHQLGPGIDTFRIWDDYPV